MDQDQLDQSSPPTKFDTSLFRNGYEARDTDVFVAVMGMTGVGKSTLISQLTTSGHRPTIGNSLSSCTRKVDVFRYEYSPATTVYLIDTPGFDDISHSDEDVLRDLATWLETMRESGIRLHGILYLHRVSDGHFGDSSKRNLTMFKTLCRSDELQNVILVTTGCDKATSKCGTQQEAELKQTPDFFDCMMTLGSRVERYTGDISSARRLVDMVLPPDRQHERAEMTLELQTSMMDDYSMNLQDTNEGAEPQGARDKLHEKARKYRAKLAEELRKEKDRRQEEQRRLIDTFFDGIKPDDDATELDTRETLARWKHRTRQDKSNIETSDEEKSRIKDECDGTPDPMAASSPSSLVRFMRTSPSQQPPVWSLWSKAKQRDINLSLRGRHCSFTGPVHCKSHLPQSMLDVIVKLESTSNIRMKRIVLGERLSYFAHYHEGNFRVKCYYNGSVREHYPSLFRFLGKDGNTGCPQAISLGPAGSYFIRVDGRRSFHCHPNAPIKTQAKGALRLWWGVDGAYVLEREAADGPRYEHELQGCYGDLGDILNEHGSEKKILDLALNIEDKCSFAVVFDDGSVYHAGTDGVICSKFDEYANKHFGHMWGDATTCVEE